MPIRKKGKLPPPVVERRYALEYGDGRPRDAARRRAGSSSWTTCSRPAARSAPSAELATDAGFRVLHTGVLIDLGIAKDFRCLGEAPRAVIRYGG